MKTDMNGMNLKEALQALKVRAQALEARFDVLNRRIREIERVTSSTLFKAHVDSDKCIRCGTCEAICPVGAIAVENRAQINADRCIGCGHCLDVCPQGAISLAATSFNHGRQVGVTS